MKAIEYLCLIVVVLVVVLIYMASLPDWPGNETESDPLETQLHDGFRHYNATIQTNASQAEIQAWLGDRRAYVIMNADLIEDGMLFWVNENVTPVYYEDLP